MTIESRDLLSPVDEASPSETFVNVPDATDVLDLRSYDFLIESLRQVDSQLGSAILSRLFGYIDIIWQRNLQKAWKLPHLIDPMRVSAQLLEYLRAIVGFGAGSGLPDKIASQVSDDDLRKLISVAVAYWKKRGRRDGLEDLVRTMAGVRPMIRDWFQHRNIVDELIVGAELSAADPIALYLTASDAEPGTADGDTYVYIAVPPPPQGWAPLNRYASKKLPTNYDGPNLPTTSAGLPMDFVLDLLALARPVNERFEVNFVNWLDTMLDGRLGHWLTVSGDTGIWTPGEKGKPPDEPPLWPRIYLNPGSAEFYDGGAIGGWYDIVWRTVLYPKEDVTAHLWFYATWNGSNLEGYFFEIDLSWPGVRLYKSTGGTPTLIDSQAWTIVNAPFEVQIEAHPNASSQNLIRLLVDGETALENEGDATFTEGWIAFETPSGSTGAMGFGPTELVQLPATVVELTG